MHYFGIVVTGKNETRTAHIRRELIHLVEGTIGDSPAQRRIAQVPDNEVVGRAFAIFVTLDIDAANPESFAFKPLHQVTADEAARPANQRCLFVCHHLRSPVLRVFIASRKL